MSCFPINSTLSHLNDRLQCRVPKLPSMDHLRNHGSPARLEEKIVSAQSIKIRAQNMFPRTVNISSGCPRKHDNMFMGWSIKCFRNDSVSAQSI